MTAKGKTPGQGAGNFRLYCTTVVDGQHYEEGPYRFRTKRAAFGWLAGQTHITVLAASLFHGEKLIAKADETGPCEVTP